MHVSPKISKILLSSSEIILDNLAGKKSDPARLKLNSIVDARVMKVMAKGKAQLMIKGKPVVAKTHAMLTEGETVKLKVVSDGESTVLKIVPKKSEQTFPPGLKETRAFGRSGLYSKLTQVLDDFLPEKPGSTPSAGVKGKVVLQPTQTSGKDVIGETPGKTVQLPATAPEKSVPSIEIKPADIMRLKQLVSNRTISWPEKVASVVLNSELKQETVLPKLLTDLFDKVVKAAGPEPEKPAATPTPDKPQVLTRLETIVAKAETALPAKDLILLKTVAKDEHLPWQYKLSALFSAEKTPVPSAELAPVRKLLLNTLVQNGVSIPDELLPGSNTGNEIPVTEIESIHTAKKLKVLLQSISMMRGAEEPNEEGIKNIVHSSGLIWEKKLDTFISTKNRLPVANEIETLINNDIKALAMKLAEAISTEDKGSKNILRSFVDGLEKMQLLNAHSSDEAGRYILPLPFFLNESLRFGQLLIDLDKDSGKAGQTGQRAIRVAFILEMSRLGHLKADFSMYKKSISGEFGVENEEIQGLFYQMIPALIRSLEEKSYIINRIGCSVISSGELAGTSLTDMVTDNPDGVLNIVV